MEANLWKTRLENKGFLCFLCDEHLTSMYPGNNAVLAGGIKLKVRVEDVDRVKDVFPGFMLTGTQELVFCSSCNSFEVGQKFKSRYFAVLIDAFKAFVGLIMPNVVKKHYDCFNCGYSFRNT